MTYYLTYGLLLSVRLLGRPAPYTRHVFYWCLLVGLFLFSGFRFRVGCDWRGYWFNYQAAAGLSLQEAIDFRDPAFWSLIHLVHKLDLPYTYLNVGTAALFFLGLHVFARRQPDPLAFLVLAFPILIINMPMSAIRQAAAIGFVCIAFVAFMDRRIIRFMVLILLGSLFHSSAMLFLLLSPFAVGEYKRSNMVTSVVLALPGVFFLLTSDAAQLASQRYIDTGVDAAGAAFRLGLLCVTGLAFLLYVKERWRYAFPYDFKLASLGAWMMVVFFSLFFVSSVIGDRFGYYLVPIQLMIFARLPYFNWGRHWRQIVLLPYLILTAVFVVWTQFSSHFDKCYVPYQLQF